MHRAEATPFLHSEYPTDLEDSTYSESDVLILGNEESRGHVGRARQIITRLAWQVSRTTSSAYFNVGKIHPCQLLKWLLPQYLRPGGLRLKKKLGPTSYLDALRGWAAWIVLNHHLNEDPQIWILRQPFFEVVHQGIAMVDIFFIISGFVLSQKILKLIREKDDQNVLRSIASSTFRRYARLYFSSAAGAAISMIMIHLNWMVGPPTPRLDSWLDQIWDWIRDMVSFSNPFAHVTGWWYTGVFTSRYCQVLWTIPVEFKASMVVFLFCAASCKFKSPTYRLVGCWLLILLCYCWQTVYVALFMFGVFLAELSLSRSSVSEINLPVADTDLPHLENEKPGREKASGMSTCVVSTSMLVTGMYLLNEPEHGQLPYLGYLIPSWWEGGDEGRQHFWMSISAALLYTLWKPVRRYTSPSTRGFLNISVTSLSGYTLCTSPFAEASTLDC